MRRVKFGTVRELAQSRPAGLGQTWYLEPVLLTKWGKNNNTYKKHDEPVAKLLSLGLAFSTFILL